MKCAEYYVDNHKIEIFNSLLGRQKVFVNGSKISESKRLFGKPHHFNIGHNFFSIVAVRSGRTGSPAFEVHKNGTAIKLVNFRPESSTTLLLFIIVVGLGLGFLIGHFFFKGYFPIIA